MVLCEYLHDFDWYSLLVKPTLCLADVNDIIMIQELKFVSTLWWRIISDWYQQTWGILNWNQLVNIFPIYDFGSLPKSKRTRMQIAREFFYAFIGCYWTDTFGFTQQRPDADGGMIIVDGEYQTVKLRNVYDRYTCLNIKTTETSLDFVVDASCVPYIQFSLSENYDINVTNGKLSDKLSLNCSWTKNPFHYQNIESASVVYLMNYPQKPIKHICRPYNLTYKLIEFDPIKLMTEPGQLVRYDLTCYRKLLRKIIIEFLCVYRFAETEISVFPLEIILMIAKSIYDD